MLNTLHDILSDYQMVIIEGSPRYENITKKIHAIELMIEQSENSQSRFCVYDIHSENYVYIHSTSPNWMRLLKGVLSRKEIYILATKYRDQVLLGKTLRFPITEKQMNKIEMYIIPSINQIQIDHEDEFKTKADYEKEGFRFIQDSVVAFDLLPGSTLLNLNSFSGKFIVIGEYNGDIKIKSDYGDIMSIDGFSQIFTTAIKE